MDNCIFCKIANKEIPSKTIYEDEKIIAIMDINPKCNAHTLIIPKKHYEDYTKLDNEIITYIFNKAKDIADNICKKLNKDGYSLVINYGSLQEVKHFHLHILPDNKNDELKDVSEIFDIIKK